MLLESVTYVDFALQTNLSQTQKQQIEYLISTNISNTLNCTYQMLLPVQKLYLESQAYIEKHMRLM